MIISERKRTHGGIY